MLSKAIPSLMGAVIVNCVSRFATSQRADQIEAFFESHPLPNSTQRISQALENIRTSSKVLTLIGQSRLVEDEFWSQF
jgi:predicted Zn-dependent protease